MSDIIKEAKKRLRRKKEFRGKVLTFIMVSLLLLFINFRYGGRFPWSLIAIGFWGIKIFTEWRDLYGNSDEELEKEIERVKKLRKQSQGDEYNEDEELDLDDLKNKKDQAIKNSESKWDEEDLV